MYKVVLLSRAEKSYRQLLVYNKELFKRVDAALQSLKTNPFAGKPLRDNLKGSYSLRVGIYRIIYSVDRHKIIIYILNIAHRREVYR